MKKLTAMLLALTLCFGLAACGGNTAQDDTKDESQTIQTGKTEDKKDEAKTEEKSDETKTEDAKTETKTDDKTSTDSKTEDKTNETKPVTNTTTAKPSAPASTSKPSASTSKPAASAPAGFDQCLSDQIRFIPQFCCNFVNLSRYFGIYTPSIVQRTIYRTAGYTCQLRNLLCGYSHAFSSLLYSEYCPLVFFCL